MDCEPTADERSGRPEYASTAAGLMKQHVAELAAFLNDALSL